MGAAVTPVTAGLAYQRHALNVLAFVTESTVEIFNSANTNQNTTGSEEQVPPESSGSFSSGENSSKKEDWSVRLKDDLKELARGILSTELVSKLLPELFFHIGKKLCTIKFQSSLTVTEFRAQRQASILLTYEYTPSHQKDIAGSLPTECIQIC